MTPIMLALQLALAAPNPLVVTRADGVHAIDTQGRVLRTYLRAPVAWAHRLPGGQLVVDAGAKGLLLIPVRGTPRPLAVLPAVQGCGFGPPTSNLGDELAVQSVHDVTHSADGRWLCLSLMDRNANMAEVQADFEVELATGKVTARLAMAPDCPDPKLTSSRCRAPKPAAKPALEPTAWPHTWQASRGVFQGKQGPVVDFCAGRSAGDCDTPTSAAVSPTGRWRLVRLPTGMGDYMHHALFALDHKTGAIYPITEGPWPAALSPKQLRALQQDYSAVPSQDVVGEAHVAATGHGETFAVDDLLVSPGERVLRVGSLVP